MRLSMLVLVLALAGCASPQQRAENACLSAGFVIGTPAYGNCYISELQSIRGAGIAAMGAGAGLLSTSYQRPSVWTGSCSTVGGSAFCSGTR